MTTLLYLKALHIIGFVTWFAGLFYLVRLFIYHAEAMEKPEPEKGILARQFAIMEHRLFYIITWPGMLLTLICGIWMVIKFPAYLDAWLYAKFAFVGVLVAYHLVCTHIMTGLKAGNCKWTSSHLRMWNELALSLIHI